MDYNSKFISTKHKIALEICTKINLDFQSISLTSKIHDKIAQTTNQRQMYIKEMFLTECVS